MSTSTAVPSAPTVSKARVAFVGAGPGDPGLLTVRAREYLAAADVVVLDEPDETGWLTGLVREGAHVVEAGPTSATSRRSPAARAKALVREATALKDPEALVVRVMSGDPAAFTTLSQESPASRRPGPCRPTRACR